MRANLGTIFEILRLCDDAYECAMDHGCEATGIASVVYKMPGEILHVYTPLLICVKRHTDCHPKRARRAWL
jgi:hypothetical protein